MHATTITSVVLTTLLAAVRAQNITNGELGSAAVVSNNPAGATYLAVLPEKEFFNPEDPRGNIKGSVSATSSPDGVGVVFSVSVSNFPTSGGPFSMCYTTTHDVLFLTFLLVYHIHAAPVSSDGNCTKTLAHLDPYIRGEVNTLHPTWNLPFTNNSLARPLRS
jgi:hypothetical protein